MLSRPLTVAVLLAAVALAGCQDDTPAPPDTVAFPLEVYRFAYPGSDVAIGAVDHGWLLRVTNPSDEPFRVRMLPTGVMEAVYGPVITTEGDSPQPVFLPMSVDDGIAPVSPTLVLPGFASGLFMARVTEYVASDGAATAGLQLFAGSLRDPSQEIEAFEMTWPVEVRPTATPVQPGDHVQTATVGVWLNGTSFYTNIATLLQDDRFPAGFPRDAFGTDPLPIYVYDQSSDEQPAGSQDRCHFTTIEGYNALLKTQAAASTGVSLVRPERAYTLEGNEGHPLYGDALIFLNTVVAHDGATSPVDQLPDPTAQCFPDRLHSLPAPIGDS